MGLFKGAASGQPLLRERSGWDGLAAAARGKTARKGRPKKVPFFSETTALPCDLQVAACAVATPLWRLRSCLGTLGLPCLLTSHRAASPSRGQHRQPAAASLVLSGLLLSFLCSALLQVSSSLFSRLLLQPMMARIVVLCGCWLGAMAIEEAAELAGKALPFACVSTATRLEDSAVACETVSETQPLLARLSLRQCLSCETVSKTVPFLARLSLRQCLSLRGCL